MSYYGIKCKEKKRKEKRKSIRNTSTRIYLYWIYGIYKENERMIHTRIHLETLEMTKFIYPEHFNLYLP